MATDRYARQTILGGIGAEGQSKLAAARVVIIGCGGLGSPAAVYLAAAGVGHLRLVDGDTVDISNLHRQVFFREGEKGSKVSQLAAHIKNLNATVTLETLAAYLSSVNVKQILNAADLVLDCTDDASTKHLINDACVNLGIPLVYAAAQTFEGYVAVFENLPGGINLRDVYPEPDLNLPDCSTTGILPTAVGIVALLQSNAALCYLLGIGNPPIDRLLTYNALDNTQHRIKLSKTHSDPIPPPWDKKISVRTNLEVEERSLTPSGYDGIYSMLSNAREPYLPEGVIRLDSRNPLGQAIREMENGGKYLVYCNSGKLSLVLAAQLAKEKPAVTVLSLRGGSRGLIG